jgi:hypothetical protein
MHDMCYVYGKPTHVYACLYVWWCYDGYSVRIVYAIAVVEFQHVHACLSLYKFMCVCAGIHAYILRFSLQGEVYPWPLLMTKYAYMCIHHTHIHVYAYMYVHVKNMHT